MRRPALLVWIQARRDGRVVSYFSALRIIDNKPRRWRSTWEGDVTYRVVA